MTNLQAPLRRKSGRAAPGLLQRYWKNRYLALLLLPGIAYYLLFCYVPLFGIQIAFRDFTYNGGIWHSPWVGLQNFIDLFNTRSFFEVLRNTLLIGVYKLLFYFPAGIIFAILLSELRSKWFKRSVQTISYLPHFVSWVILGGLFLQILSPTTGPVNMLLKLVGIKPIYFLADTQWFRSVLVITSIWKETGWDSIIYIAAIAGINFEIYESAYIDGANRFQRIRHITIPSLAPVITIMLIFAVGRVVKDDFNQVFSLYNPSVYKVGDVLSTYIYRMGLVNMKYSFATAVGLFKNVVAFAFIIAANTVSKKVNDYGIW